MSDDLLQITSRFDSDRDGWTSLNSLSSLTWQPSFPSGNFPDGHLLAEGASHPTTAYFVAPDEFLGDRSAMSGGTLSFLHSTVGGGNSLNSYDVFLTSPGVVIGIDLLDPQNGSTPKLQKIDLVSSANIRNVPTSAGFDFSVTSTPSHDQADQALIDGVLANLDGIYIRAEYDESLPGNPSFARLDNVEFRAPDAAQAPVSVFNGLNATRLDYASETFDTALQIARSGQLVVMNDYTTDGIGWERVANDDLYKGTIVTDDLTVYGPQELIAEFRLGFGVEEFAVGGSFGRASIIGNALDNRISGSAQGESMEGGSGEDTLNGEGGADELFGGDDDDSLYGGSGIDDLWGEGDHDFLDGGSANDILRGGIGNDTLRGGTGDDLMEGGAGDDTYRVDSALDIVVEYAGEGTDTVETTISLTLASGFAAEIENLSLIFGGNIDGTGNALANVITGNAGRNTINGGEGSDTLFGNGGEDQLDGGVGADTMYGGSDNDTYMVDDSSDQVIESEDRGDDIVYSTVSYDVPLNVEVLILSGSANLNATGTDSRDQIFGNAGENIINGAGGFDVMQGGAGNDTYAVDNSLDAVIEAAGGGFDNVYSSVDYALDAAQEIESAILTGNAVTLRGSDSDNQLFGNAQVNVIDGRGGTDYMLGLGGADIFQINLEPGAVDVVGDFSKAEGDRLAFTGFNQATTFVNQASATSFEVRDTKGTADFSDDIVQTFILNDSYGSGTYTQGALVFGVDYYFG